MAIKNSLPPRSNKEDLTPKTMSNMIESQLNENEIVKPNRIIENKQNYQIMLRPSLHEKAVKYAKQNGISLSVLIGELIENNIK